MPMYRKKPVVIEAVLWDGKELSERPDWLAAACDRIPTTVGSVYIRGANALMIETLEGTHRCDPGDYIIRGVKGELYPCKPDIFALTYEEAPTDG